MGRGRGEGQRTGRMRTGGGKRRSPSGNVGRHLRVPPCGIWDGSQPHWGECVPAAGASPRPTRSERIGLSGGFRCIPAAGHIGPALRDHTEPGSGGAEGPLALSPQQCEAWIENVTAPIQSYCTKSNKYLKIPTLKVLLDFFQKIAVSKGRAFGRASQGAKLPLAAASETPARRNGRNPLTDVPAREWPAGLRPACRRLRGAGTGDRRRGRVPGRCGPR